ncbi:hypothetical protein XENORESO_019773 [Xenotaenia resolanae]|uniref:Uncharacterized protein n=1 Tax=Xenotaenia resolanae TaxID=208358 RepID=A0ABV0W9D4_9TELE
MSYSITQIITKNKDNFKSVISERPYDCLYDPVYTVSSEVDHTRANFKAYAPRGRFVSWSTQKYLFSEQLCVTGSYISFY